MAIPESFAARLTLPVIGSPMFLASGPELVLAQCKAGIIGTFPALNARPAAALDTWLERIRMELATHDAANPKRPSAPFGVNLILHKSNARQESDLACVAEHRVPLVISSVGRPDRVVDTVRGYGGLVFHDVVSVEHARKAASAGVDGLILVCTGAGGHGGSLSPFVLVSEVREFWDGPLVLAGALSSGRSVRTAEVMGADLAYMGTRFIATQESAAAAEHKAMIVRDRAADVIYTPAFSGIFANYLKNSVLAAGIDPLALAAAANGGKDDLFADPDAKPKAWKDVWSAGQGIGTIHDIPTVAELVQRLQREYAEAAQTPARYV